MKRRPILLGITVAIMLGVGALAAMSDEPTSKAGPTTTETGGTQVPGVDGEQVSTAPAPFTVPAASAPRDGVTCPTGWSAFDNPTLHYSICTPQGWGFSEFATDAPLTQIRGVTLGNLHLLSANAFPWRPGTSNFDAILDKDIVDIELDSFQPATGPTEECNPSTETHVGDLTFLSCIETLDATGQIHANGIMTVLKILVPLAQVPSDTYTRTTPLSPQVNVVIRSTSTRAVKEADFLWQIARTIRPY